MEDCDEKGDTAGRLPLIVGVGMDISELYHQSIVLFACFFSIAYHNYF